MRSSLYIEARRLTMHRIIRKPELRSVTGLSTTTTERLEKHGSFPQRIHLTGGHVGWWLDEVIAWLEARPRGGARSTAPATAARHAKLTAPAKPPQQ
jgi:prophage regulatory protein